MTVLLDVNILIACAWSKHPLHLQANRWLDRCESFATSAITEMGFLRVSMSPAYGAVFAEAQIALRDITALSAHRFIHDATRATTLSPDIVSRHDVTDAHLISLAKSHRLHLATFDEVLCAKPWAKGIATHPLKR